jgi:hypothetical protein
LKEYSKPPEATAHGLSLVQVLVTTMRRSISILISRVTRKTADDLTAVVHHSSKNFVGTAQGARHKRTFIAQLTERFLFNMTSLKVRETRRRR